MAQRKALELPMGCLDLQIRAKYPQKSPEGRETAMGITVKCSIKSSTGQPWRRTSRDWLPGSCEEFVSLSEVVCAQARRDVCAHLCMVMGKRGGSA